MNRINAKIRLSTEGVKYLLEELINVSPSFSCWCPQSLEWRQEWGADSVLEWEVPEVLTKYYPVGMAGHDKTGCPGKCLSITNHLRMDEDDR